MGRVIQFDGAPQTKDVAIQQANVLIVCMDDADARHIRATCCFDDSIRPAFLFGKDPVAKKVTQGADIYFVASGGDQAAGQEFANWLGKPIYYCFERVQELDATGLLDAFEAARQIKPAAREAATTSMQLVTNPAVAAQHSAEVPMEKYLRDILPQEVRTEGDVTSLLDARRFDQQSPPVKPTPILAINGKPISTGGNLTVVSAQAKSGKSAVLGAMMGALLSEDFPDPAACIGFEGSNPERLALVHFDTEQSPYDAYYLVLRALRRAGVDTAPAWLRSYCLTDLEIKIRRRLLNTELQRAKEEHGGICAVLIDGIADFCADPNNSQEAFDLVAQIHTMAIEFACAIICVLHENPSVENIAKTRGHLGSQLERKAETNLRLAKDSNGISVIFAERARHCHIPKAYGPRFQWNPEKDMHVLHEEHGDERAGFRREELRDLAEQIFDLPEAIHGLKWGHAHERIEELLKITRSGARKKFMRLTEQGFIRKCQRSGLYIK